VLVVGNGGPPQAESEAILRELKFAVAPAADVTEALRVLESLQPDLIVARTEDVSKLRAAALPVVEYTSEDTAEGRLVERLRDALRTRRRSR
jgi:hypothetical protein